MLLENYDEQAVREVFRNDGIAEGRAEALAELMKNGNFSEDRACELLGISEDERTRLLEILKEKAGKR